MLKFRFLAVMAFALSSLFLWRSLSYMMEGTNPFMIAASLLALAATPFMALAALFFFSFSFVAIRHSEGGGYVVKKNSLFGRVFIFFAGDGEKGYCLAFWRTVGVFFTVPLVFAVATTITTMVVYDTMKFLKCAGVCIGYLIVLGLLALTASFLTDVWDHHGQSVRDWFSTKFKVGSQTHEESRTSGGRIASSKEWLVDMFDELGHKLDGAFNRIAKSRAVELLKLFHSGACPRIHVE